MPLSDILSTMGLKMGGKKRSTGRIARATGRGQRGVINAWAAIIASSATVLFAALGEVASPSASPEAPASSSSEIESWADPQLDPPPQALGGAQQAVLVSSYQCFIPGCSTINAVLKYDAATGAYLGAHVNNINGPTGMARHPATGRLLVASRADDLVNEYDMHTGAFIRTFVQPGAGGLNVPQALLFRANGNLLVTSTQTDGSLGATNGIIEYDGMTGAFVRVFIDGGFLGENCGDARCLFGPNDMKVGSNGHLYVTSGNNDLILEYDAVTGDYINYFDSGALEFPNGLLIRPSSGLRPDNLIVTSLYLNPTNPNDTHKLLEFDDITHELITTGGGVLASGLETPGPLMWADDGNLLIGDRGLWHVPPNYSDRIVKRNSSTGAFISYFTPTTNFNLHYSTGLLRVQIGCLSNGDCNDLNPCTDDVCNGATNTCTNTPNDANNPNDGQFCNGVEASCSNGQVVYSQQPPNCNDNLTCTQDSCNESTDSCNNAVLPGFCRIAGVCRANGEVNPGNTCQACNASANPNGWSSRPAGTLCGSSVDNECDNPDSCNASGVCLPNFEPVGRPCGTATDTTCTNPDTCNGSGACLDNNAPNGSTCNDGLACTVTDTCATGYCFGTGTPCNSPAFPVCREVNDTFECVECAVDEDCNDDGLFCTVAVCDVNTFTCMHVPDDSVCDDGLYCNGSETCNGLNGACIPGSSPCLPGDTCDEVANRCIECSTNAECNDGLFCNGPESCAAGQCRSGNVVINNGVFNGSTGWTNSTSQGGTVNYTGNRLNVTGPSAGSGGFTYASQGGINFQGGVLEFDLISFSNLEDSGTWDYPVLRIDTTFYGLNSNGTLSGPTTGDNDGSGNINNSNEVNNVHFVIDMAALVGPGSHSVGFGVCSVDGEFTPGVAVFDNAVGLYGGGNPCPDACNEGTDQCIECVNSSECNDGLFCNGVETCQAGTCVDGTNPCAGNLICVEANDQCVQCLNDGNCNDNLFCNGVETCVSNVCQPGSFPCLEGQTCEEATDECTGCGNSSQCDDGDPCNGAETCVAGQCQPGTPIPNCCTSNAQCNDGNICNGSEACVSNLCQNGTPLNCNDNLPCTSDSCHPILGCQHSNLPSGSPCGDQTSTPCNLPDTCNPIGDCQSNIRPNGTPCPDGLACNGAETCSAGVCQPGTPIPGCCENNSACDNGNPCDGVETCSNNTCVPGTPIPGCCLNNSDCSNFNVCDGVETCVNNVCVAGTPLNCNDNNPCTINTCHATLGCQSTNAELGTPCGSPSNTTCDHPDTCNAGACQQNMEPNGTSCPDGVLCNGDETCQNGVCTPGVPPPHCCETSVDCDNESVCDGIETCVDGECLPGTPLNCGDGNPCTDDLCDPVTGCSHANNSLPCDDGDPCTGEDICLGGLCEGTGPAGCNGNGCTDCNEDGIRDDCQVLPDCDNNQTPDACEPIGDGDADCDVDLSDSAGLQRCFRGSDTPAPAGCFAFDVNNDGKVDLSDWAVIAAELVGP